MRGVYSVSEVRAAEDALLARTSSGDLMIRAATGLARTCAAVLQESVGKVYGSQVVILVGAGNNGGDALFAGASLVGRGATVTAVQCSATAHDGGLRTFRQAGGRVLSDDPAVGVALIETAHLVIDGILGIGGRGELKGTAATLAEAATRSGALVVAVDLPSGVDSDTGVVAGAAIWADVTVTFGALKPALHLPPGDDHVGLLDLVDIGLSDELTKPSLSMLEAVDVAALLPHPVSTDHKYSQGVVGVAAGSDTYPGAAVLCVGAALLTKPGLVRYSGSAADDVVRAWPSAIVSGEGAAVGRVQAWAVGPGIGTDDVAREQLSAVLQLDLPTIVDADGLTLLAANPELLKGRSSPTVLTPHEGEFGRLATGVDVAVDRVNAVRELADRLDCTVLLKGSTTVVADPGGQARLNITGTPWLATGGTGDVLTGMVAAYLASGLSPLDAASLAAFVHGIAGRIAADGGPCTSYDVVRAIPDAVRDLNAS